MKNLFFKEKYKNKIDKFYLKKRFILFVKIYLFKMFYKEKRIHLLMIFIIAHCDSLCFVLEMIGFLVCR